MKLAELLSSFQSNEFIHTWGEELRKSKGNKYHLKGMVGSQQALMLAALYRNSQRSVVVLLNDKEEALYFQNDLQSLMPKKEVLLFPASYKRPYQVEEVDNANVLQRAEVLNELNHTRTGRQVIVTFAEALNEKVVNKQSLIQHTLDIKKGEEIGMEFVVEVLEEYGFEREDFVYEPGQYAIRGGILDVFSFAHDLPYRIDFFDKEVDKIRTFDPASQMTEEEVKQIALIPNVQRSLMQEKKVSFLDFIPSSSLIFVKNIDFVQTDLERLYEKASKSFEQLIARSGGGATASKPEDLYLSREEFLNQIEKFTVVQTGRKDWFKSATPWSWKGTGQPVFKKEFTLLASHFKDNQRVAVTNLVVSPSQKQLDRLKEIFDEIDPEVAFTGVKGDLHEGFLDPELRVACYTDHQIFERYHRFKVKAAQKRSQAITLKELRELNPRDYVTHITHGIGQFAGLHRIKVGEHYQEAVKIIFSGGDAIFVNVNSLHKVAKYTGKEGTAPKLSKLGTNTWGRAKAKAKKRIKELAFDLVDLYARRKATKGFAFDPDGYLQRELEASFMYEDTPDQLKTTEEVKGDMEKITPMDRLVCGDVGFGKTEIAIRAAFKAAVSGKQTAVLVPTTILALQHYKTFRNRLKDFPVTVDYVNRFKSTKQIKETVRALEEGKVDILIGTHRLVSKDVKFKNLGLLIVDEEQRFGVSVKEKLKAMKATVDTLTLTATPIPRTLQFSLLNIRDLSVISTPPPNRQPIETIVATGFDEHTVRDAIAYELKRGGQVYLIHPRVKDIEEVSAAVRRLVPDARIGIAHGQMTGAKLEEVMTNFIEGAYDVLVATKIVESGLDISNANTIIINQAQMYGLSELHQMRGRVGRSNRKAFCYLLAPAEISLTPDARKRLNAMEEFSDLGSGFHIALRDLDIRGAGDLLGPDQSGFIAEIGYDVYHKILDEAVKELQEEHFEDLFAEEIAARKSIIVEDTQLDLELDIRIPESYVPSTSERLLFYRKIANATEDKELREIQVEMLDRFGPLPGPVLNLFDCTRLRELSKRIGVERVTLKGDQFRLFFVSDHESHFYTSEKFTRLLSYVQLYSARVTIKESKKYLSLIYNQSVENMKQALGFAREVHDFVNQRVDTAENLDKVQNPVEKP
ncbi:MAG: transcription-repair coupling factor [Bacteroidota bacterium]